MTYQTMQAQPQALPSPSVPLVEGSVTVALVVYIVKELIGFFKRKDASEEKLVATLIEDLRADRNNHFRQQSELLERINTSHEKIAIAIDRISASSIDINNALQLSKRTETEILYALRENTASLVALHEKVDRLVPPRILNHAISNFES